MVKNPRHALPDKSEERTVVIPVTVESFASFYSRDYRALLTLAHALTGDPGVVEDLVQETFLAAFLVWKDIANPGRWVRTAVSNKAMSRGRRERGHSQGDTLTRSAARIVDTLWRVQRAFFTTPTFLGAAQHEIICQSEDSG
jgi:DNA-directed RNA polymerase specialized sigma24 family protein